MDPSTKPGESPRLYTKTTHLHAFLWLAFSHALARQRHRYHVSNLPIKRPQLGLPDPAEGWRGRTHCQANVCQNPASLSLRCYNIPASTGVAPQGLKTVGLRPLVAWPRCGFTQVTMKKVYPSSKQEENGTPGLGKASEKASRTTAFNSC